MSGCFASELDSCGMNRLRKISSARSFSMCGARRANSKADPLFPPGCWRLRDSRHFLALRRRKDAELDDEAANAIEDASDDPEVTVQKKDTSQALRSA